MTSLKERVRVYTVIPLHHEIARLVRFIISGAISTATNLLSVFLLVHFLRFHYLIGSISAFIISIFVSFTLQKFWTFKNRDFDRMHFQFMRYVSVALVNLCINTSIVYALVEWMGAWYLLAQFFAGIVVAITGYLGYQKLVFKSIEDQTL